MAGRTLAALALDRRDDHTNLAFVDDKTPASPQSPSTE
jgi:hypothetical protein